MIEAQKLKIALESENYKNAQVADLDNAKRKRKLDLENIKVSMGIKTFPTDQKVQSEKKLLNLVEEDLNKIKATNKN